VIFNRKQQTEEPFWSVKRQKGYKVSRILWIVQIAMALLASVVILLVMRFN
jgi:hypothetical protein